MTWQTTLQIITAPVTVALIVIGAETYPVLGMVAFALAGLAVSVSIGTLSTPRIGTN